MPVRKNIHRAKDADILVGKKAAKKTVKTTTQKRRPRVPVTTGDLIIKPGPTSKYDWETARDLFLTSQPALNLRQIGLRLNIPYQQVRNRSTRERWMALRAQHQTQVLKEKRTEFLRKMAGEAISFDQTAIDTAKLGMGIITGRLIELSNILAAMGPQTAEVVAKLRAGEPLQRSDLYSAVNYKEMASLAQAALMFQQIGRIALGSEVTDGTLLNDENTDLETVVSIGGELTKDDPARLAAFLEALERAGMTSLDLQQVEDADEEDTDAVITLEGEIIQPGEGQKQIEAGKAEE